MNETARYVAYFRMPATGDARRPRALARQRAAVSAFLAPADRSLVGEFTEVGGPSRQDDTISAFDLAIECCRRFEANLLAAVPDVEIGAAAREIAREAGVAIVLIEPAAPVADEVADGAAPYLPLGTRHRMPAPPHPAARAPVGNRQKADAFARAVLPIIEQIRAAGATSLTDIADELNARRIRTARGRRWYPTTVRNILIRARRPADDA